MEMEILMEPRLIGERFSGHRIPLEILSDFDAFNDLFYEVAKTEFLNANKSRRRVPKRFKEDAKLFLTDINDGSAKLVICFAFASSLFFAPYKECFEQARFRILKAIESAEQNTDITSFLSKEQLTYFHYFGKNLKNDESIEFCLNDNEKVHLNKETRLKLILASSDKEYAEETAISGYVKQVDEEERTFVFKTKNGLNIVAPINNLYETLILELLARYDYQDSLALFRGIGIFTKNNEIRRFGSLDSVESIDPLDTTERLKDLELLEDGWFDGEGKSLSSVGLSWLSQMFEDSYPKELPLPHLFPTIEGQVRSEWTLGKYEIFIDIDIDNHLGYMRIIDVTDTESDGETINFNFNITNDWTKLCDIIYNKTKSEEP